MSNVEREEMRQLEMRWDAVKKLTEHISVFTKQVVQMEQQMDYRVRCSFFSCMPLSNACCLLGATTTDCNYRQLRCHTNRCSNNSRLSTTSTSTLNNNNNNSCNNSNNSNNVYCCCYTNGRCGSNSSAR
jgi:hypothetical protein